MRQRRLDVDEFIELAELEEIDDSLFLRDTPTCWNTLKDEEFSPGFKPIQSVPAGFYEILWNSALSTHVLKKLPIHTDELYSLPSPEITDILKDIESFWNNVEVYKKYKFIHKRGILLYGDPGCGKSGIIQLCVKQIIEKKNGIVINIKDEEGVRFFSEFIPTIRKIEPNRPLIVLLEDIDSIAGEDNYSTTKLLNILDGIKQIENVVYIATTNYPEKLQERISNRPARFDRRYEVKMPSKEIRKSYLEAKLSKEDLDRINIEDWLTYSEGMSLAHLKEMVISVIVLGQEFADSVNHLSEMKKAPKIKRGSGIGFKS